MDLKPKEIIDALSKEDQGLVNNILMLEKRKLHHSEINPNSKEEKEIITEIIGTFNDMQHSIELAIASACPLCSAPIPG